MRYVRSFVAVAVVCGFLGTAAKAQAGFVAPLDVSPYLPAANKAQVKFLGTNLSYDKYQLVGTANTFYVIRGTPMTTVLRTASIKLVWGKFYKAYCVPAISQNPPDLATASAAKYWFSTVILPLY